MSDDRLLAEWDRIEPYDAPRVTEDRPIVRFLGSVGSGIVCLTYVSVLVWIMVWHGNDGEGASLGQAAGAQSVQDSVIIWGVALLIGLGALSAVAALVRAVRR
jgi:hypothetical protein